MANTNTSAENLETMLSGNGQHRLARTLRRGPTVTMSDILARRSASDDFSPAVFVITCSDARLNPYSIFGVDESNERYSVMIRNAGGRVFDLDRTLAILGRVANPGTLVVMHHTDCGMLHIHEQEVVEHWVREGAAGEEEEGGLSEGQIREKVPRFGLKKGGEVEESLHEDVAYLRASPFVMKGVRVVGLKYDVVSGGLEEIVSGYR